MTRISYIGGYAAEQNSRSLMRSTVLVLFLVFSHRAAAQGNARRAAADSSAAAILAQDPTLDGGGIVRILRQTTSGVYPRQTMTALADSLTARAIAYHGTDLNSTERKVAWNAVLMLGLAGISNDGGQPFDGALERLIRVHRESPDRSIRSLALRPLLNLPNRARALAYLREVAISTDETARVALDQLMGTFAFYGQFTEHERAEAATVAQALADSNLVRNPNLARELQDWAERRKRQKP